MPQEVQQRCLEPFFTTKGDAGTGLGLAMVYGIIQCHGGTLDIQSTPGIGTTFIISLPATSPAADEFSVEASGPISLIERCHASMEVRAA